MSKASVVVVGVSLMRLGVPVCSPGCAVGLPVCWEDGCAVRLFMSWEASGGEIQWCDHVYWVGLSHPPCSVVWPP